MKKLFTILVLASLIWACNDNGQKEPPAEDENLNSPTAFPWKGRVMADTSHWVTMARYNPEVHTGYDTVLAYVKAGYTGELPDVDEGWAGYLTDSTGNVHWQGYKWAEVLPMGGGLSSVQQSGYSKVYIIHINK